MSPKIGLAVPLPRMPASVRPLDVLRAAVASAEAQGVHVRAQDLPGVERSALSGAWKPTQARHTVNLVGAVCLTMQPDDRGLEESFGGDAELAAVHALGARWIWLQGALDGLENTHQQAYAGDELYRAGIRAGHLLYADITVECVDCGERRSRMEASCHCGAD